MSVSRETNRYIREVLHAPEAPPPIRARYFYTSPLAIDDPLSPIPPPATGSTPAKQAPRPFSLYDNEALDKAWLELRKKILSYNEQCGGEKRRFQELAKGNANKRLSGLSIRSGRSRNASLSETARSIPVADRRHTYHEGIRTARFGSEGSAENSNSRIESDLSQGSYSGSPRTLDPTLHALEANPTTTTGNPFIRAPSRSNLASTGKASALSRPMISDNDSYNWGDDIGVEESRRDRSTSRTRAEAEPPGPTAKVPVGVSRLHNVVMGVDDVKMEPIYWPPVNDIAPVIRGTWFYKENMLPVETDVANMLEAGYITLQPWSETWNDELNSAVEVGALGETKILHKLWPEKPKKVESRPGTSRDSITNFVHNTLEDIPKTPEQERKEVVEGACDIIDISTGPEGPDNKAIGTSVYGRDGKKRIYPGAGIIYANEKDAYILRPSLQPSAYYGRRPLANYIRKGHQIGVAVCRGFDQDIWDKLNPPKKGSLSKKAFHGVSSSQSGIPPSQRQMVDSTIAQSERPEVTDLILVIHGIGQKLSERIESFHFTHAMNALRREVNVELGTDSVKSHLRKDMGGIMLLPVNWRLSLSFEDGGYRDEEEALGSNQYSLKDITPETLPSVRNIISDVMLDVPYYLSREHNPKMVTACVKEANRIYRLWCLNNPGFAEHGRVHILAHSLGSVMAVDVLSQQPTEVPRSHSNISIPESKLPASHFAFNTSSLFICGSPVGFFLLLKNVGLLPRNDNRKANGEDSYMPGVTGEVGTYGCLAVDNIYNVVNPYDPVAYRANATVDVAYSESLKPAFVPSASSSWLDFSAFRPFRSTAPTADSKPNIPRLPSTVELETHNFTREEIAEKRAYLLNDNGQIDWFLKYGGGALEIQYLTMLGAHSSYWISKDFIRFIVVEVGRPEGREGTVSVCRAVKKKGLVTT